MISKIYNCTFNEKENYNKKISFKSVYFYKNSKYIKINLQEEKKILLQLVEFIKNRHYTKKNGQATQLKLHSNPELHLDVFPTDRNRPFLKINIFPVKQGTEMQTVKDLLEKRKSIIFPIRHRSSKQYDVLINGTTKKPLLGIYEELYYLLGLKSQNTIEPVKPSAPNNSLIQRLKALFTRCFSAKAA